MRVASSWDSRDRMALIPWLLQEGPALLASKSRSTFLLALSPLSASRCTGQQLPDSASTTLGYFTLPFKVLPERQLPVGSTIDISY